MSPFQRLFDSLFAPAARRTPAGFRPRVEALEGRAVPSGLTVHRHAARHGLAGSRIHIGTVNPYTDTSSYRYYDPSGYWSSWSYSSPSTSWEMSTPSSWQDLYDTGYARIGTVNAYTGSSSYDYYTGGGDATDHGWDQDLSSE